MANILIIDDEPQIRLLLRNIFESEGYSVTEASDGNEGLTLYDDNKVDLILMDLYMPDKEGLETINELKKAYPEIKIIAMSGGGGQGRPDNQLNSAKMLGAVAAFEKPVRNEVLLKTVRELI